MEVVRGLMRGGSLNVADASRGDVVNDCRESVPIRCRTINLLTARLHV